MAEEELTALCPECGEMITVHDPVALIRALHLINACSIRNLITRDGDNE